MSGASRDELRRAYEARLRLLVPADAEELARLPLMALVPERVRPSVVAKVRTYSHFLDFAPGEVVIRAGEWSDSVYAIVRGTAVAALEADEGSGLMPLVRGTPRAPAAASTTPAPAPRIETLGPGELFGDRSALSRFPVSATVKAWTPLRVLRVRLPALRMLTAVAPELKRRLDERYREEALAHQLRRVGLLAELPEAALDGLRERATLLSFSPGQVVAREGTRCDVFYLVRGGHLKLSVDVGGTDLAVTYLRPGDFAGETAILLDERWPFSLQAVEHAELVRLEREDLLAAGGDRPRFKDRLWQEALSRLKTRGAVARHPVASGHLQMAIETGLIHGESVLLIDLTTCTRCDDCVEACADTHGGRPVFVREGRRYRNWLVPTACYQCSDPVCLVDCPTGAIRRELQTLEVTIDAATCIGCSNCARRCPWDNIVMVETGGLRADGRPDEVAVKCDLCRGRAEGPACVSACPHGSAVRISFKDADAVRRVLR
jgi:Fe-S-cluster-containing hydrogenase component 2/CRP-like cAMP-binding protein